jgi:transcriptional regulator with XRE-family HTH domain
MTTVGVTGSTVPRRQLGRYLRDLRNRAHLTVRSAARRLEWSETKIWRIETGQTALRGLDVQAMCVVYGAPADLVDPLVALAKETKARGWWLSYGDVLPEGFDVYVGLEEAASCLRWYECGLIPGLLQTEDYARTLISLDKPDVPAAEIDRRVQVRVARQGLLDRYTQPMRLRVALDEAILHRPIGSPKLMAAQLNRLVELGERANVSIRIVPFAAGVHVGVVTGPFVILEFPLNADGRPSEPPTVYVDTYTGALYLEKPHEIEQYDAAFSDVWEHARDATTTRDLIHHAARELTT